VKWIDKVLDIALERRHTPLADDEPVAVATPIAPPAKGVQPDGTPVSVKH
jgi:hypothetical protein